MPILGNLLLLEELIYYQSSDLHLKSRKFLLAGFYCQRDICQMSNISDEMSHEVSQLLQKDSEQRARLLETGLYVPNAEDSVGRLHNAFKAVKAAEGIEKKIRKAIRKKELPKIKGAGILPVALEKGVITQDEFDQVKKAEELRNDAIQVDDFGPEEFFYRPEINHGY